MSMKYRESARRVKSYCLELADSQGWHIIATKEASLWVEKLASIMGLKTGKANKYRKLIIIRRNGCLDGDMMANIREDLKLPLPINGWISHDLRVIRFMYHSNVQDIIYMIGEEEGWEIELIRMEQALLPIYQRTIDYGGLPLHAALVEKDGRGVLLGGSGGAGKSTCCSRIPPPWHVLCDDETLIVKDSQKLYVAHPFPTWSDYLWRRSERTWNVERSVPLIAIFFLEQSERDEVVPIGQGQAAIMINQLAFQVSQQNWKTTNQEEGRSLKIRLFNNASELARSVPSFILRVSLTGQFWKEIEKVLE